VLGHTLDRQHTTNNLSEEIIKCIDK